MANNNRKKKRKCSEMSIIVMVLWYEQTKRFTRHLIWLRAYLMPQKPNINTQMFVTLIRFIGSFKLKPNSNNNSHKNGMKSTFQRSFLIEKWDFCGVYVFRIRYLFPCIVYNTLTFANEKYTIFSLSVSWNAFQIKTTFIFYFKWVRLPVRSHVFLRFASTHAILINCCRRWIFFLPLSQVIKRVIVATPTRTHTKT